MGKEQWEEYNIQKESKNQVTSESVTGSNVLLQRHARWISFFPFFFFSLLLFLSLFLSCTRRTSEREIEKLLTDTSCSLGLFFSVSRIKRGPFHFDLIQDLFGKRKEKRVKSRILTLLTLLHPLMHRKFVF